MRVIDETSGCVTVDDTNMHGVTRIPVGVPYVVTVFSKYEPGSVPTDTLDIVIVNTDPTATIPAETAVSDVQNCMTACDTSTLDCSQATDANNYGASPCNQSCWLTQCPIIPFDNSGATFHKIVGIPMGGGDVKVKWVYRPPTPGNIQGVEVSVHVVSGCTDTPTVLQPCSAGCIDATCRGGELIYSGGIGSTVYFRVTTFTDISCTSLVGNTPVCSSAVLIE